MKTFSCQCGNTLHFENTLCLQCGRHVAFLPDVLRLSALEPEDGGSWRALWNQKPYHLCGNQRKYDVCNWAVAADDSHDLCLSCRLNHIVPNLENVQNLKLWYRIESAKRRLLYTLFGLRLPVTGRDADFERGLAFEFIADPQHTDEFSNDVVPLRRVMTGHRTGVITINLMEAEDSARERMRERMNERYRTLLGHFRHESGHYYWDRLISGADKLRSWRELFGDEQRDYAQALNAYYTDGAPGNWQQSWISPYASAHPWEDWAETWAHYLHMVDTLETAHDFGFSIDGRQVTALDAPQQAAPGYGGDAFSALLEDWGRLTVALNALNRSMGLADAYPFAIGGRVLDKLRYVHDVIGSGS